MNDILSFENTTKSVDIFSITFLHYKIQYDNSVFKFWAESVLNLSSRNQSEITIALFCCTLDLMSVLDFDFDF